MAKELHFYSNGVDTVIAKNIQDAIDIWEKHTGESWGDYMDGEDGWTSFGESPNELITATWDGPPPQKEIPNGGEVEHDEDNNFYYFITATAKEWIDHCGRGYFSCIES